MNGGAHATIGAATGLAVALKMGTGIEHTFILAGAGMVSSLVPDLDTGGKLANRISVSSKYINAIVRVFGLLLAFYAYVYAADTSVQYVSYIGAFLFVFILPTFSKKFMLMVTGIIVGMGGYYMTTTWLILFGIYVVVAAFLSHRSYTHSLLGVFAFSIIAHYFVMEVAVPGLFVACVAGYVSHLIADMRLIPGNKRGIKPLLPYKGLEL